MKMINTLFVLVGILGTPVAKEPQEGDPVKNTINYYEQLRQQIIETNGKPRDAVPEVTTASASADDEGSDDEYDDDDDDDYDFDYDADDDGGFDEFRYGDNDAPPSGAMSESLMIALGLDVTNRTKVESDWIPPAVSGLEHSARKDLFYLCIRNTTAYNAKSPTYFHLYFPTAIIKTKYNSFTL